MTNIYGLFVQVLTCILMLIPGIILYKMRKGDEGTVKGLSTLILYFAQPAMIIYPFVRPFDKKILSGMAGVFVFSFALQMLCFVVTRFMFKRCQEKMARVLRFAIVFGNVGYMGIPLVEAVLGTEAAIYATVYSVTFNMLLWSVGSFILTKDVKYISPKKIFINPSIIAVYIATLIFFLSLESRVPEVAVNVLKMLKGLVAPVSMIIVGYHMAGADFARVIKNKSLWASVTVRLVFCPVIMFCFLKAVSAMGIYHNEMAATVLIIASSTPAATALSMLAERFDGDTKTSGVLIPLTTVLSVATMPLCLLLMNLY